MNKYFKKFACIAAVLALLLGMLMLTGCGGSSSDGGNGGSAPAEAEAGVQTQETALAEEGQGAAGSETDQYLTEPVPEGKPVPVEPQHVTVDKKTTYTCTISIECGTILDNMDSLIEGKEELIPADGVILAATEVSFNEGESVFDVLKRVTKDNKIHFEFSNTPIYNSAYIEGINNLYEFDCGGLSGWVYDVNGWFPNYGCSRYSLQDGDVVHWYFTCDLGRDVGNDSGSMQKDE